MTAGGTMNRISRSFAVLGCAAAAVWMLAACGGATSAPAVHTVTVTAAPTTATSSAAPNQLDVDQAVAMDGVPVDWSSTGSDAYLFVDHVCNFISIYPGGPDAINWKTLPIPGVMTAGGMAALVAGVPIQCPQYAGVIHVVAVAFFPGVG